MKVEVFLLDGASENIQAILEVACSVRNLGSRRLLSLHEPGKAKADWTQQYKIAFISIVQLDVRPSESRHS